VCWAKLQSFSRAFLIGKFRRRRSFAKIFAAHFTSEKRVFRKKSARICKISIDPSCGSYMVVLPPETGGRWCRLKLQFGPLADGFEKSQSEARWANLFPVSSAGQILSAKIEEDGQRVERR